MNKSINIYSFLVETAASLFGSNSSAKSQNTVDTQAKIAGSLHEIVAKAAKQRTLLANEIRDLGVGLPPLEHSHF